MSNLNISAIRILDRLNTNSNGEAGLWLPNIQRRFVWSEDQICKLFDSLMRKYPISTFLVWKTNAVVRHREFIQNFRDSNDLVSYQKPDNSDVKQLVLDGQQRLQSLFIGLKGSYNGKELCLNILSQNDSSPEDVKYEFKFIKSNLIQWPYVNFKKIIYSKKSWWEDIMREIIPNNLDVPQEIKETIGRNIDLARNQFKGEILSYQLIDGIEEPDAYKLDDVVEIFIRANSGGTKLSKSDLLFSLLISEWDEADEKMEELLRSLNFDGFEFERDFILKTCLTILGKGARYEVQKFKEGDTKEQIINKWADLGNSIKAVKDFLTSNTSIRNDKAIPSYLALIPIIYFHYHFPTKFKKNTQLKKYILDTLISGVFSGSPDALIDKIVKNIKESEDFELGEIFKIIEDGGRNLKISKEIIFKEGYKSSGIHLLFNILYTNFNYAPSSDSNRPHVDHIFPQVLLKEQKVPQAKRDQIANCMLLSATENSGEKSAAPPNEWFDISRYGSKEEQEAYLRLHLIPSDPKLWKIENYEKFIEARKILIAEKFKFMLRDDAI